MAKRQWISVTDRYPDNGQRVEVKRNGKIVKCVFLDTENYRSWKFPKDYIIEDYTKPDRWRPVNE